MLHIQSSADSDKLSPPLPRSVERELRLLLQQEASRQGLIDEMALNNLPPRETRDSNEVEIARFLGADIVADGGQVVDLVLEGLKRRLAHPIVAAEQLHLVGASRHEPA